MGIGWEEDDAWEDEADEVDVGDVVGWSDGMTGVASDAAAHSQNGRPGVSPALFTSGSFDDARVGLMMRKDLMRRVTQREDE